jgi:hypothetical protein
MRTCEQTWADGRVDPDVTDGWTMNWFGNTKGEGIEYFVMLSSLFMTILVEEAVPCLFIVG